MKNQTQKNKLIVIEGPQGVGKTTYAEYIRERLPYTNLYRLYGTNDNSSSGLSKSYKMYKALLSYMKQLEGQGINLLFDRTFFTEFVYCNLGYKEYQFKDSFFKLLSKFAKLNFDIFYITLYLKDTNKFRERLDRGNKAKVKYAKFDISNSIDQQNEYLKVSKIIKRKYENINCFDINTDRDIDEVYNDIDNILNIEK